MILPALKKDQSEAIILGSLRRNHCFPGPEVCVEPTVMSETEKGWTIPLVHRISAVDFINLLFLLILVLLFLAAFSDTPYRIHLLLIYPALFGALFLMVWLRRCVRNARMTKVLMIVYPVIFLFAVFETFFMLLPYFNESRYDEGMASIDFSIFHVHPTAWLEGFAAPPLTEMMYLLYLFYFPLPLFILLRLYRKSRWLDLERSMFVYLFTYYGAYIVYFFLPVAGPRYHLTELHAGKLEGLVFSEPIRRLIDVLEPNKLDCFPSLHAAITLLTLLIMNRYYKKMFFAFLPVGAGITLSLVYCRYHYVVDVAAGIIWAAVCYFVAGGLYDRIGKGFARHFGCAST